VADLLQTLEQLVVLLGTLVVQIFELGVQYSLLLVFLAFSLFAINWKKMWPTLAEGAWVGLVLIAILIALVWTMLDPASNFLYRLGGMALVVGAVLFLGWLQGVLRCTPPEISLEPPAGDDHGHGHHH
jgi:hypothetical protein